MQWVHEEIGGERKRRGSTLDPATYHLLQQMTQPLLYNSSQDISHLILEPHDCDTSLARLQELSCGLLPLESFRHRESPARVTGELHISSCQTIKLGKRKLQHLSGACTSADALADAPEAASADDSDTDCEPLWKDDQEGQKASPDQEELKHSTSWCVLAGSAFVHVCGKTSRKLIYGLAKTIVTFGYASLINCGVAVAS